MFITCEMGRGGGNGCSDFSSALNRRHAKRCDDTSPSRFVDSCEEIGVSFRLILLVQKLRFYACVPLYKATRENLNANND